MTDNENQSSSGSSKTKLIITIAAIVIVAIVLVVVGMTFLKPAEGGSKVGGDDASKPPKGDLKKGQSEAKSESKAEKEEEEGSNLKGSNLMSHPLHN